ncbi:helix-turn-helix domain-containing protein [Streptomyces inhibens]|uniref:helix-turn-helix domain-containing protein n=1 Tax=Streptomyces inhibens TaxID=2293571 RepID=UPI0037B7BBCA
MLPATVARARRRGVSWDRIGRVLNLNKDSARRKYKDVDRIVQRLPRPRRHTTPVPLPTPADDDTDANRPPSPPRSVVPPTAEPSPTDQLAPVLSHLQRASQLSLRSLGERTGVSASHLSRVLSGERFPDWNTTARLARACGADPAVLRTVWEAAYDQRGSRHDQHTLDSALRYVHHRAGAPSTWAIAVASGGVLDQDLITAVLDGTTAPDWDTVRRLVLVLDGEPTYFRPLWEATCPNAPESPAPFRPAPPASRPRGANLADMLHAFSETLGTGRLLPSVPDSTPSPGQQPAAAVRTHPMPRPIPALGRWADALPT